MMEVSYRRDAPFLNLPVTPGTGYLMTLRMMLLMIPARMTRTWMLMARMAHKRMLKAKMKYVNLLKLCLVQGSVLRLGPGNQVVLEATS